MVHLLVKDAAGKVAGRDGPYRVACNPNLGLPFSAQSYSLSPVLEAVNCNACLQSAQGIAPETVTRNVSGQGEDQQPPGSQFSPQLGIMVPPAQAKEPVETGDRNASIGEPRQLKGHHMTADHVPTADTAARDITAAPVEHPTKRKSHAKE